VGHAAAALLIMAPPLVVLGVVLVPPVVMARHPVSAGALALWATALALLAAWGAATYRSTVRADAAGTDPDPLGTTPWLVLALGAALASLAVSHRSGSRLRR
jgi:hypothetical protein